MFRVLSDAAAVIMLCCYQLTSLCPGPGRGCLGRRGAGGSSGPGQPLRCSLCRRRAHLGGIMCNVVSAVNSDLGWNAECGAGLAVITIIGQLQETQLFSRLSSFHV